MKVVLHVLTIMSVISPTEEYDCTAARFPNSFTVKETDASGTLVFRLAAEKDLVWSIIYDVNNNSQHDTQLSNLYKGAVLFSRSRTTDLHRCQWLAGLTHCQLELTKTLDVEHIARLTNSRKAEVLKVNYLLTCDDRSRRSTGDSGQKPARVTKTVTLTVTPVNEFVPEFNNSLRDISITELTRINTVIKDLKSVVRDRDNFNGGGVQKIMLENGTDWLRLDGTKVVLAKEIRFEELVQSGQTRLWFQLSAKDSGGRVGKGMMIVHIEDVDNRPPYFSSLGCQRLQPQNCSHPFYEADVPDDLIGDVDSIRPAQILAEDGDIMLNATIRYSFLENEYTDYVQIDGQTGTVRVVANLTMFLNSIMNLTVVATEDTKKKHHSTVQLYVQVTTLADMHPPYFSSLGCQRLQPQNCSHPFYTAEVHDYFTGDVYNIRPAQIQAEDGDILCNHSIRYSFLENEYTDYVKINGETGIVRVVAALTKFRGSTINFTVVATEDGDLQRHSVAHLVVHVANVKVRKGVISMVSFMLSLALILALLTALALSAYCIFRRMKKSRKETGQQGGERRHMDSLQAEPSVVPEPISSEQTQELTSSQPSETTDFSADPSTLESMWSAADPVSEATTTMSQAHYP